MINYKQLNVINKALDGTYYPSDKKVFIHFSTLETLGIGFWHIALGGYDTGYILSYGEQEIFRINAKDCEYEWLTNDLTFSTGTINKNKIIKILQCENFKSVS